jgi:hypothetical protein
MLSIERLDDGVVSLRAESGKRSGDGRRRGHSNEVSPLAAWITDRRGTTLQVRDLNIAISKFLLRSYTTMTGLYRSQELPNLLEFSTSNPHTRASSREVLFPAVPSAARSTSILTVEPGSWRIFMRPCSTKSCNPILDVTMKSGSMTPALRSQRSESGMLVHPDATVGSFIEENPQASIPRSDLGGLREELRQ